MDYKEIRKQHIKPTLKHLLDDWLDRFFFLIVLIFLLIITFVGFTKIRTGTEMQQLLSIAGLVIIWVIIPVFYDEV